MKKSNKKGIWIPKFILDDNKLDAANKIIYAEIISLTELKDGCFDLLVSYNVLVGDFIKNFFLLFD